MKQIAYMAFATVLAATPIQAQDENQDMSEGFDLLQQGTRLLLEGLFRELGPAILEFEGKLIELNAYRAPEILPNGDIIIRRKVPLNPLKEGETDL